MVPKRSEIRFRSGVISSELYAPIAIFRVFSVFSPLKLFGRPSPHLGTAMETPFPPYRLLKVS